MSEFGKAGEVIDKAMASNRLHHSVLIYGENIKELEALAKYAARNLLGTNKLSNHPDFFELRPEGKARFIKIGSDSDRVGGEYPPNTMRALLEKIRQTSNAGGRKVAIVYEADRMNLVAANAFLKTLEEPPSDTNIFLLTERPNDLLDTIKSRCVNLRLACKPAEIEDEQWEDWLKDFSQWQKNMVLGFAPIFTPSDALLGAYSMLNRFDEILSRLSDMEDKLSSEQQEELDADQIAAIQAGERRGLRKRMLASIEDEMLSAVMEASEGKVPSVKLSRAISALEKSSTYMELNMQDTPALEYFFLNSLRIWSR